MAQNMDIDKVLSHYENFPYELLYSLYASLKPFKQGVNKYEICLIILKMKVLFKIS